MDVKYLKKKCLNCTNIALFVEFHIKDITELMGLLLKCGIQYKTV